MINQLEHKGQVKRTTERHFESETSKIVSVSSSVLHQTENDNILAIKIVYIVFLTF